MICCHWGEGKLVDRERVNWWEDEVGREDTRVKKRKQKKKKKKVMRCLKASLIPRGKERACKEFILQIRGISQLH